MAIILPNYLQYSNFLEQWIPIDWLLLELCKGKTEKDSFEVEYESKIA